MAIKETCRSDEDERMFRGITRGEEDRQLNSLHSFGKETLQTVVSSCLNDKEGMEQFVGAFSDLAKSCNLALKDESFLRDEARRGAKTNLHRKDRP